MSIELRILSGARAGQIERFEQPVIAIGRHPLSDLRFDATRDLDVSTRHGSIHGAARAYALQDSGSRNGTFVNGERIEPGARRDLQEGDVIAFGAHGPTVAVHFSELAPDRVAAAPASPAPATVPSGGSRRGPSTGERIARAVRAQTRRLRIAVVGAVVGLGGLAAVGFWMNHREFTADKAQVEQLVAAYNDATQRLQHGLRGTNDTALINELSRRNDSLVRAVRGARSNDEAVVAQQALQRGHDLTRALNAMDLPALHQANDSAIVLISSDVGDHTLQASGFCVRRSGLIVTNRHVVSDSTSRATHIVVKFADTPTWRRARLVKLDDDPAVDLALVQVDEPSPRAFPTVHAIASSIDVPVGSPIATLGFVFGTDIPMEGDGSDAIAATTLTPGTVSKTVSEVLQIDSYASHGSSGSPVIDAHDHVIGVVYGGQPGTGGRIVFAVPADRLTALLGAK